MYWQHFKRNRWLFSLSLLTRIPGLFREPENKANFEQTEAINVL